MWVFFHTVVIFSLNERSKYQYIFSCIRFYSDLVQDCRGGVIRQDAP